MLNSVSWDNICAEIGKYHDLVNEMSFRKQIHHLQISKSKYDPHMNQPTYQDEVNQLPPAIT